MREYERAIERVSQMEFWETHSHRSYERQHMITLEKDNAQEVQDEGYVDRLFLSHAFLENTKQQSVECVQQAEYLWCGVEVGRADSHLQVEVYDVSVAALQEILQRANDSSVCLFEKFWFAGSGCENVSGL